MRRGKGIYARGSSGKAGGVIRHCRKVKANRRELVFDYGRHWVKIRFTASGARVLSR